MANFIAEVAGGVRRRPESISDLLKRVFVKSQEIFAKKPKRVNLIKKRGRTARQHGVNT
jgi:hypothetical protein